MKRNEEELGISEQDTRFVRRLEALYRPPAPTAASRARFDARLEERLARDAARRPWLLPGTAAAAAAAAALAFALLPGGGSRESVEPAPELVAARPAPSSEAMLLLVNGPLEDADEALPDDYRMIASLLE